MKSLFIINENMDKNQLEHSYLLILAMLNFDHHVDLVFINNAFISINNDDELKKRWLALKIYGVDNFYSCGTSHQHSTELTTINQTDFEQLKTHADILS